MVVVSVIDQDVEKAEPHESGDTQNTLPPSSQETADTQHTLPPPYSASYGATGEGPPGYEQQLTAPPAVVDTSGVFIFVVFQQNGECRCNSICTM